MALNPFNEWSDFWRYQVGVNALPTKGKRPLVQWKKWQNKPIPEHVHNQWKKDGAFSDGISIIPGKVWHNKEKQGLYLIFLDADKQYAITELCTSRNEKQSRLTELS
jgi:hypothetical protein